MTTITKEKALPGETGPSADSIKNHKGGMNSSTSAVHTLLSRLDNVLPAGKDRWSSRCPSHEDKNPSLSIRLADDHRVLLFCHAGCPTEDVLTAVGLEWKDLYPDRWEASYQQATARQLRKVDTFEQLLEIDRLVLRIAAEQLRAGKTLTIEDSARVEMAKRRLTGGAA